MKRVKIVNVSLPDKNSVWTKRKAWGLFLKPGYRFHFQSRTTLHKYLSQLNKQLNAKVHELNDILNRLHEIYRSQWFYFYDEKDHIHLFQEEKHIKAHIRDADMYLSKAVMNTNGPNGNTMLFVFLENVCFELSQAADLLSDMARRKDEFAQLYRLKILTTYLDSIRSFLEDPPGPEVLTPSPSESK